MYFFCFRLTSLNFFKVLYLLFFPHSIELTSLPYVTREFYGFLRQGWAKFFLGKNRVPRLYKEINHFSRTLTKFKDFWRQLLKFKIVQTMVISEGQGSIKNPTSKMHLISKENIQTLCDKAWLWRSKACCHFSFFTPLKYHASSFWIFQTLTLRMKIKRLLERKIKERLSSTRGYVI